MRRNTPEAEGSRKVSSKNCYLRANLEAKEAERWACRADAGVRRSPFLELVRRKAWAARRRTASSRADGAKGIEWASRAKK